MFYADSTPTAPCRDALAVKAALPPDEVQRLEALQGCQILDTVPEGVFDDITRLAAEYLHTPISLVSLVDETRQWFKSHHGLPVTHTPREFAFCAHAILAPNAVFEVEDATLDPRFADNPLVTGEPHIRYYAGVPLVTSDNHALGTLNVIDVRPRRLADREKEILTILGRQVSAQLELRRKTHELHVEVNGRARSEAKLRTEYEDVIQQLRESKSFSEHVTQIMPSVLYVFDFNERRTVYVNREVVTTLGYDREVVTQSNDPVLRFMHPDDQPAFAQHMQEVRSLPDRKVAEFTYRMRHADGDWRWMQSRDAVMTRNEDGSVSRIVGTATEITAIKRAEEAMRASEQRFRALAESSAVGIGVADVDARLTYANKRASTMIGLPSEQCLGTGWHRMLHPDDRERVIDAWRLAVEGRVAFESEFRFTHLDGEVIRVFGEGRPLATEPTQLASYVATFVDVTAMKEVEQLRVTQAAAEQANKAKSEFVARMSHEFRTPLNAILGFTQLMQLQETDARQSDRLAHICRAGEHLLEMINETLDLARIEAGRIEIHAMPISVSTAAAQCVELVQPLAQQAGVAVHNLIPKDLPLTVLADATRLNEILLNLLSNAIKYNRPGGHVRLTAEASAKLVRIDVEDNGVGIRPERIGELFEPFNRLDAKRGTVEGTGLGLTVAQRLALLMGGTLRVRSQPGVGSVFTLELPSADAVGADDMADSTWNPAPRDPSFFLVVYIEDNPANALLLEQILETRPRCHLRLANDGRSGIAAVLREVPDLVLIDLNLPDITGYEVLDELRANPTTNHVPCIAVSADARPENVARIKDAGFSDFWPKPINVTAVLTKLDTLMEQRRRD